METDWGRIAGKLGKDCRQIGEGLRANWLKKKRKGKNENGMETDWGRIAGKLGKDCGQIGEGLGKDWGRIGEGLGTHSPYFAENSQIFARTFHFYSGDVLQMEGGNGNRNSAVFFFTI